ncbi:MAG TPA: protein kinase [Thermoanaerobaculia bacterium]|nr:protein kinase [Thermoanaerobaculia bacterium]
MTLVAGTKLGPYEILSPLGAGGMGEVYRARDTKLDREVAVKVLPAAVAQDPTALARFEREAKAVAALSHPNILAIHDFGAHGGTAFAVTELLEGETLREILSGGALPARRACEYALQMARGLAAAHEKGIVHRDLKPDNVFVTRDGRVKILDFGLAKPVAVPAAPSETKSPTVSAYTEPGAVMGTVGYMSPEQVKGQPLDPRSDIFSFGSVLYEMLSGRRAFQRDTVAETMAAILKEDPPEISESGRKVSPALERLVRHCLEKSPESRFQSVRDLAFALESLPSFSGAAGVAQEQASTIRPRARAAGLLWAAAGAVFAATVTLLLTRTGHRSPTEAPVPKLRFAIPPPAGTSIPGMLALSPDGHRLAFVATDADGRDRIWIRGLDEVEARVLDGTDGASYPFWSPDSRSLAFFAARKLKRIEVSGGSAQVLCEALEARGGTWGSIGTIVFSVNAGGEIRRVSERGGQSVALPGLSSGGAETYRFPSFLPDGRHFLLLALSDKPNVQVASLDSGKRARLVAAEAGPVYASPGYLLYRSGDRVLAQRLDADGLRLKGEAFPVIDQVWWDAVATGAAALTVSQTGLLACQTGGAVLSRLLLYERSGHDLGAVGPDGAYWEPTLSPDARWLAVSRVDPDKAVGTIWTFDLDRGSRMQLPAQGLLSSTPLWSGDGRRILHTEFPAGGVYLADARGSESERLLFRQTTFTPLDDWSRDGRLLFYEALDFQRFHTDVWVRDLETGASRPVLQAAFNQTGARLSPDGRWLAYESDESGTPEIFVRSFPEVGERRQISNGGGRQARWRGDGKELFYISPDRKVMSVEIRAGATLEAGAPKALFQTRIMPLIEARNHYDVAPDGQRFVVNSRRSEDASLPITVLSGWMPEKAN